MTRKGIAATAKGYLGIKETKNNSGFNNLFFQQEMKKVGWQKGQPWCMYFVKLVWLKNLKGKHKEQAAKLLTGHTQGSLNNFKKDTSGLFEVSTTPQKGSIVIWEYFKNGKSQGSGHAGIVTSFNNKQFQTIEGNTNKLGGREGVEVARKTRSYAWQTTNGLRLKAFINIKQ